MNYIIDALSRYPVLEDCRADMEKAVVLIHRTVSGGGKLLLCGNGGSAADCAHISGEFLKGFLLQRPLNEGELSGLDETIRHRLQHGIPAIPLPAFEAALTAVANDVEAAFSYAQLVFAFGKKDDIFFGISTSGNARNVCVAAETAKAMGLATIALCGSSGGRLAALCDCVIRVPETETYKIQELHLPVYHALCAQCEAEFFGGKKV